jgi:hypothetical protein
MRIASRMTATKNGRSVVDSAVILSYHLNDEQISCFNFLIISGSLRR